MKLKDMKKEELEALSYTDLTEMIIKENKKSMNTLSIFNKICELLELDSDEHSDKIGDYYTSLTTDKRFILLETAEWDLKDKHKVEIVLDYEDDEELEEDEEENENALDSEDESIEITDDEVDLDDNDDLDTLTIVDDEELEDDM